MYYRARYGYISNPHCVIQTINAVNFGKIKKIHFFSENSYFLFLSLPHTACVEAQQ